MRFQQRGFIVAGLLLLVSVESGVLRSGENDGQASNRQSDRIDWTPLLPDGPGKEYVTARCGGCHGVGLLMLQRRTKGAWRNDMVEMNVVWESGNSEVCSCKGGPIAKEEIEIISSYLGEVLGPKNPIGQLPFNINTDSPQALLRLPGLGPSDLQKLLDYRGRTPFRTKGEIEKLLGGEKFRKIEDFVDVKDSNFRSEGIVPM